MERTGILDSSGDLVSLLGHLPVDRLPSSSRGSSEGTKTARDEWRKEAILVRSEYPLCAEDRKEFANFRKTLVEAARWQSEWQKALEKQKYTLAWVKFNKDQFDLQQLKGDAEKGEEGKV